MQVRLAVFDLDGTLTRGPTVCEAIAARLGKLERMVELERATTDEEITAARLEMASWYAGVSRVELYAGLPEVPLAPGAVEGLRQLRDGGVMTAIVSITWSFAVDWFASRLGVDRRVGTALLPDGTIEHFWSRDKEPWMRRLASEHAIRPEQIAAVGDSPGDLEMLEAAAVGFFVGPRPPQSSRVIHEPGGDISVIVEQMLTRT